MHEKEFPHYYNYHLNYAIGNNLASEEDFFLHVWQIVQTSIKHLEIQDPFSRNHSMHRQQLEKLQQFQKYLKSIDDWNARPFHIVFWQFLKSKKTAHQCDCMVLYILMVFGVNLTDIFSNHFVSDLKRIINLDDELDDG